MEKQPVSSNLQGLENDEPLPKGTSNEIISYDAHPESLTTEHQPTGEVIKEQSDIYRLQDEDFRLRVHEIEEGTAQVRRGSVNQQYNHEKPEYDPVVHPDAKPGRIHISIRYDNEQNQLIVHIINAEGIIRPEQIYAPEMCLLFSLIGHDRTEYEIEKQSRYIVQNAPVTWKEPLKFCVSYEKMIEASLHITFRNHTDPSIPHDREVLVPLNILKEHNHEINEWFNLQHVKAK